MTGKENRRTKLTKTLIKNSLIELMQKQSIHKITVKDICLNADVNRSTFYSYYTDQYDLLNEIEDEIFENLKEIIKDSDPELKESNVTNLLEMILEYVASHIDVCELLMSEKKDFDFQKKIWRFILENFIKNITINREWDSKTTEYIYLFAISGCMGLVQAWMENGMDKSPKEMAEMIIKLTISGFHTYC